MTCLACDARACYLQALSQGGIPEEGKESITLSPRPACVVHGMRAT